MEKSLKLMNFYFPDTSDFFYAGMVGWFLRFGYRDHRKGVRRLDLGRGGVLVLGRRSQKISEESENVSKMWPV